MSQYLKVHKSRCRKIHEVSSTVIYMDVTFKISLLILSYGSRYLLKVKVSPIYDPYVGECLLERTLVLSHQLFEVGWPVPFLAAFISPVFPSGPHSLLGGQ